MQRKRYYVSVQAGTIMEYKGESAYELDIEATPDEVHLLHELFESEGEADFRNYVRMHSPEILEEELVAHGAFDRYLSEVYKLIHRLGTAETKAHVESMNVLNGIQHGYRSDV